MRSTSTYYILVATQGLSIVGSRTSSLAVGIAVFHLTGHATPLALINVFSAAAWVVIGGLGGAIADRFDRRRVMLAANVGYALASALLLAAFVSGRFQLWQLYALTVVGGALNAVETPALQASIAMLVPDQHRDRANAIQQLNYPTAVVLSAAFAGVLYATVGVVGAILVDLGTFAVAIAVLALVRIPMPETSAEPGGWGELWRQSLGGMRYLVRHPPLLAFTLFIAVISAIAGSLFWALFTAYGLDRLHATAVFGFVTAAGFTGAIGGAVVMAAWGGTRPRIHTVLVSTVVAGAGMSLVGVARTAIPIAGALFLLTFAIPFVNAALSSIYQAKVAPDWQGRVFSALGQLSALLGPIASLAAGPLADRVAEPAVATAAWRTIAWAVGDAPGAGIGLIYLIAGLCVVVLSLAAYASPAIRNIEAQAPANRMATS